MSVGCKVRRVALFHPCLIHGGIQRVFVNLARGLLEQGVAVDMVQATPEGEFHDEVPPNARLVELNATRALTSVVPLLRYLRRERPDFLISGAIQTNIVAAWARKLSGVTTRLILTEHNIISAVTTDAPVFRARVMPFFVRAFYPWADDLIAVSQGAAKDLSLTMGIPIGEIHVIYNPIVDSVFWQRAAESVVDEKAVFGSGPVVLAVGRLHYHKDYPTLLRAFDVVQRTMSARLVFLGDGEERANLEALTKSLGLESQVVFLGNVSNPIPYMKRAAVLALSSIVESLGNVLIEAMAVGLPIVATDCPTGPREILGDSGYGSLVPVRNIIALADALVRALQSRSRPAPPPELIARFRQDYAVSGYLKVLGINERLQNADCPRSLSEIEDRE